MKKVNLLLAAVVAASVSAPALADYTPNAYFNGYMRAGVGVDKNGKFNGNDGIAQKVGRLGNESNLYGEIGIGADVAKVDNTVWTVNSMISVQESSTSSYTNLNGDNNNRIALRQFNVEVKGLFESDKDALVWVGKRYVQREDIHITDLRYYDISGEGAGIENVSLGSGKFAFSYVQHASDKHTFDARYSFPIWDGATLQIGNAYSQMIRQTNDGSETSRQANGNMFSIEFTQGFNGGWNKTVLMWKTGNECGNLGTAYNYNDGNEYDFYNFGETTIAGDLHLFHQVDFSYIDFDHKSYEFDGGVAAEDMKQKTYRVVLRPWYKLTKMTRIVTEFGAYGEYKEYKDGTKKHDRIQKATLAYAITPDAGNFWSRPEIRFFATWLHGTDNDITYSGIKHANDFDLEGRGTGYRDGTTDMQVGVQVEAWW